MVSHFRPVPSCFIVPTFNSNSSLISVQQNQCGGPSYTLFKNGLQYTTISFLASYKILVCSAIYNETVTPIIWSYVAAVLMLLY